MGCPAQAGIGPSILLKSAPHRGLPRASGDRPTYTARIESLKGVAPRKRG